ncbi:MAG TPA: hypothetical protein VFM02_00055 [Candidatus Paceibacterota bacterium]|nr:hypothetical protein [Candidatus Paceibacterota bacterium]
MKSRFDRFETIPLIFLLGALFVSATFSMYFPAFLEDTSWDSGREAQIFLETFSNAKQGSEQITRAQNLFFQNFRQASLLGWFADDRLSEEMLFPVHGGKVLLSGFFGLIKNIFFHAFVFYFENISKENLASTPYFGRGP